MAMSRAPGIKAPRGLHKRARVSTGATPGFASPATATPESAAPALPVQGSAPLLARLVAGVGLGGTPEGPPGAEQEERAQSLPAALHASGRPTPVLAGAPQRCWPCVLPMLLPIARQCPDLHQRLAAKQDGSVLNSARTRVLHAVG